MSRPLPSHGRCLVCGPQHPEEGRITLFRHDDGRVTAQATPVPSAQGPPGFAHGGWLAAILDEVMGAAAWTSGHRVMAVHLELDYRAPVPLQTDVAFTGWVDPAPQGSRKVHTHGEARLPDGRVCTEARGIFAQAPADVAEILAEKIGGAWGPPPASGGAPPTRVS